MVGSQQCQSPLAYPKPKAQYNRRWGTVAGGPLTKTRNCTGDAEMEDVTISRIRPVSWKVFVQGAAEAEYVRQMLEAMHMETTPPREHPGLVEPPLYAFVVTSESESPLTTEEIAAVLERDGRISLAFDT
jgi:hypothetical protein